MLDAVPFMQELSRISGLPLWLTTAEETVALGLIGKADPVLPMKLQEKYFDLPEQKPQARPLFG